MTRRTTPILESLGMAEAIRFGDLPARLLAVLNDPVVERIIITNNRLYTESSEGSNPEFGERIEKFQNGVKVKTIIKKIESLNG